MRSKARSCSSATSLVPAIAVLPPADVETATRVFVEQGIAATVVGEVVPAGGEDTRYVEGPLETMV